MKVPSMLFRDEALIVKFIWFSLIICMVIDAIQVFISFYFADLIYVTPHTSFSSVPRGVIWMFLLIDYFLYIYSRESKPFEKLIIILLVFVLLVNLSINQGWISKLGYLVYTSKLTLPLLMYRLLSKIEVKRNLVFFIFSYFVIQSFVVIFSAIFDVEIFRVYGAGRFGYSGLMVAANQLSFVYIAILILLVISKKWISNFYFYILLFLFTVSALFLGTKVLWGALIVFYISLFLERELLNKGIAIGFGAVLILVVAYVNYKYSVASYFVRLAEDYDWLYVVTSKRNVLIEKIAFPIIREFNLWNYLFGGINVKKQFVEMDFVDIFMHSGLVGLFLIIYGTFKTLFSFESKSIIGITFIVLYFAVGIVAGHSLVSGLNFIFLPIVCIMLKVR